MPSVCKARQSGSTQSVCLGSHTQCTHTSTLPKIKQRIAPCSTYYMLQVHTLLGALPYCMPGAAWGRHHAPPPHCLLSTSCASGSFVPASPPAAAATPSPAPQVQPLPCFASSCMPAAASCPSASRQLQLQPHQPGLGRVEHCLTQLPPPPLRLFCFSSSNARV